MKNISYLCIVKNEPPYNPPRGISQADDARNLFIGNPLRWAVLQEVIPYSGGRRQKTAEEDRRLG